MKIVSTPEASHPHPRPGGNVVLGDERTLQMRNEGNDVNVAHMIRDQEKGGRGASPLIRIRIR